MNKIIKVLMNILAIMFLLPIVFSVSNSFMDTIQLSKPGLHLIPKVTNIMQYYNIVVKYNEFFIVYLNTIKVTIIIIFGQTMVSIFMAYYLIRTKSKIKNVIYFIYIFLMILPLQITLIPNTILFKWLEDFLVVKIFDTHIPIIMIGIFNTMSVVFLKQSYENIPKDIFNLAEIDGASNIRIIVQIIIPYSLKSILVILFFVFIDCWNMIEQILVYVDSMDLMTLPIYLETLYNRSFVFNAGAVLYMFPTLYIAKKVRNIATEVTKGVIK